jgi:Ca2+:H+ antiporter
LIFSIAALATGKISVAQTAVIGSILSNTLLVLGLCYLAATWDGDMEDFPQEVLLTNSRLLLIALGSLVTVASLVTYNSGR